MSKVDELEQTHWFLQDALDGATVFIDLPPWQAQQSQLQPSQIHEQGGRGTMAQRQLVTGRDIEVDCLNKKVLLLHRYFEIMKRCHQTDSTQMKIVLAVAFLVLALDYLDFAETLPGQLIPKLVLTLLVIFMVLNIVARNVSVYSDLN